MAGNALIVVDVQRDFCEGGALAVPGGNAVAEAIARSLQDMDFLREYNTIVFTKDFHKPDSDNGGHIALPPAEPDFVDTWPPHCLQGTPGVALHDALSVYEGNALTFYKGDGVPAYSGFEGARSKSDGTGETLNEFLAKYNIDAVDVCGLAADYCVRATMDDGVKYGFDVGMRFDLTAGIRKDGRKVWEEFTK